MEENGPVSRSLEEWEESSVRFIYAPVFTVNLFVERELERAAEREEVPHSKMSVGDRSLLCCFNLEVSFCHCSPFHRGPNRRFHRSAVVAY